MNLKLYIFEFYSLSLLIRVLSTKTCSASGTFPNLYFCIVGVCVSLMWHCLWLDQWTLLIAIHLNLFEQRIDAKEYVDINN